MQEGGAEVAAIRQSFLKYGEVAGSPEGKTHLDAMYHRVRALTARAGLAG
jgi:hypothetical protein